MGIIINSNSGCGEDSAINKELHERTENGNILDYNPSIGDIYPANNINFVITGAFEFEKRKDIY